jgi:acetyl esterase
MGENKYHKYKSKYINLKSQGGGNRHNHVQLEGITQKFVDSISTSAPIYKLSPNDARKVLDNLQKVSSNVQTELDGNTTATDVMVSQGDHKFLIRIIKPKDFSGLLPVVVYYHGGGWVLGNRMTHDHLIRELSYGAKVCIVFVEYTPSPEAKFTTIIEECYGALNFIAQNGQHYGLDTNKIAIAGDSVGGNLSIAMTLLAKERGPKILYQALFYPVTDAKMNTESYHLYKNGPWLTANAMQWFWDAYSPKKSDREDILLSPINATQQQLRGLPPALIITDENDVLRDEGEQYARNLMAADVPVTAVRFLGTIHDFMMLNSISSSNAARGAINLAIDFLRNLHR